MSGVERAGAMEEELRGKYRDCSLTPLERAAIAWLEGFYQLEHLLATRRWAIQLSGGCASGALKFACLVHDAERFFPGGPTGTPQNGFDDADYLFAHSMRSADIVGSWLKQFTPATEPAFQARVRALILRHELGGNAEEDVIQAADSLAFLSTFDWLIIHWVQAGHYTAAGAREKLDWTVARIRVPEALRLALPLYATICGSLQGQGLSANDVRKRRALAGDSRLLLGE